LKEKDELSQHQIAALKSDFTQKLSVAVKAEEEAKTKLEHKLAEEKRIKDAETQMKLLQKQRDDDQKKKE